MADTTWNYRLIKKSTLRKEDGEEIKTPTEKQLNELSAAMAEEQEGWVKEIEALEKELEVSYSCAMDVWYLRTRSRHTPELEKELIELHKKGQRPNMNEWP